MKTMQAVFVLAVLGCALTAGAQGYPTRPISIVVAFSAGGPADTIARIMAEHMTRRLGQTVVVDNVTGAGGSIGVGRVVRAAPDGYPRAPILSCVFVLKSLAS